MFRAMYTAASGMYTQQFNMDVLANNLANVNTTGFKASRVEFQDLLYQQLRQAGSIDSLGQQLPLGLEVGSGAKTAATQKMFSQGSGQQTNNPTDLMVNGDGFFQVSMPDGTIAYTRDGSFQVDGSGNLVTANGYQIQPPINIPSQATGIVVRSDGQVQITLPQGQPNQVVGQLQLVKFVNPAGLTSNGQNLYTATDATGTPQVGTPGLDGLGTISQGFLESSNVQVTDEMVNLIMTQRAYESDTKVIQAGDTMLSDANQLVQ